MTQAQTLENIVIATINARTTYDGMSLDDIATAGRLIDAEMRAEPFEDKGEKLVRFVFPDGSAVSYMIGE